MKKTILTAVAAAAIAVGAQAQECLTAGQPYTFTGTAASGTGTITYQWYRNNEPIAGATDTSYIMPGSLAFGSNVEIKRGVASSTCPYNIQYSGSFTLTFYAPLRIGSTTWAAFNVDSFQTFASCTSPSGRHYQWNKDSTGWHSTPNNSATWTVNPCPAGWRLPTKAEFDALISSGSSFAAAGTRGYAYVGVFFGPNSASCNFINNMTGCIFFPSAQSYYSANGMYAPASVGYYWSATQYSSANGYQLSINTSSGTSAAISVGNSGKASAMSIRCVQ